jgi:hypothetical protein
VVVLEQLTVPTPATAVVRANVIVHPLVVLEA